MANKYFSSTTELNGAQYDILWDSIKDNPELPSSGIAFLNKSVNTSNKTIIGAINEVLVSAKDSVATTAELADTLNNYFGNPVSDPTVLDKINAIDTNLVNAVYKIYEILVGDAESPLTLDTSVIDKINTLEDRILNIDVGAGANHLDVREKLTVLSLNTITIPEFKPNAASVELDINSITYTEGEEFSIDRETGIITWEFTALNNGFDIETDFDVRIQYRTDIEQVPYTEA